MRVRVEKAGVSYRPKSDGAQALHGRKNEFVFESEWREEAESSFDEMPYLTIRVREKKKRTNLASVA